MELQTKAIRLGAGMLGDRIKDARERRGLTQEELAEKAHVVRQTVSKWEKSQSVPDADTLMALAEALNVTTSDLIGEDSIQSKNLEELTVQSALLNEQLKMQERRIAKTVRRAKWAVIAVAIALVLAVAATALLSLFTPMLYSRVNIEYSMDGQEREAHINVNYKKGRYSLGYDWPSEDSDIFSDIAKGPWTMLNDQGSDTLMLLHMMEVAIENAGGTVIRESYQGPM